MKVPYTFKAEKSELDEWKSIAAEMGVSMSEFIRGRCNTPEVAYNPKLHPPVAIPANPRNKKDVATAEVANRVFSVLDKPEHDKTCQCGICAFRRKVLKNG